MRRRFKFCVQVKARTEKDDEGIRQFLCTRYVSASSIERAAVAATDAIFARHYALGRNVSFVLGSLDVRYE